MDPPPSPSYMDYPPFLQENFDPSYDFSKILPLPL